MTIFSDIENRIIHEKYIRALEDDEIDVQDSVIQKAKQGDAEAIYSIGLKYKLKGYETMAIWWLGTSSAMGFYESQIELAHVFHKCKPGNAIRWYRQAIKNGVLRAHVDISDILASRGKHEEAEEELKIGASSGDPYCQNRLGLCYYNRINEEIIDNPDTPLIPLAKHWLRKSAEQNYPEAQYHLARLYEYSPGAEMDLNQALYWYEKSKAGGYPHVESSIERLNLQGYFYIPEKRTEN